MCILRELIFPDAPFIMRGLAQRGDSRIGRRAAGTRREDCASDLALGQNESARSLSFVLFLCILCQNVLYVDCVTKCVVLYLFFSRRVLDGSRVARVSRLSVQLYVRFTHIKVEKIWYFNTGITVTYICLPRWKMPLRSGKTTRTE